MTLKTHGGGEAKARVIAVIPAHNEETTIGRIIEGVLPLVDRVHVVDDGSSDSTADEALQAGANVVTHQTNLGVGRALQTGYGVAAADGAELIIQLDADGQHDPCHIKDLLAALDDVTDIVIGSRFIQGNAPGYSFIRRWGIRFFSLVTSAVSGCRIYDVTSGFRVYRVNSLMKIPPIQSRHWAVEQTLMALRLDLKIEEIAITIPPRRQGVSQFNPNVALRYPIRMLFGIVRAIKRTAGRQDGP